MAKNTMTPKTNEAIGIAAPMMCPNRLVRLPPSSRISAPASGNTSSSQAARWTPAAARAVVADAACAAAKELVTPVPSILEQAGVVDRRGPAGTEDRHEDGQPHHHLGGGHDHDEEGDDLPVQVGVQPGEGHEREVDRVQHELHAHEDDQGVAAHQHADRADDEQDHSKRYEVRGAHGRASSGSVPAVSCWLPVPWAASPPGGSGTGVAAWPACMRSLAMTGLTESEAAEPSGSRAAKSTALCLA